MKNKLVPIVALIASASMLIACNVSSNSSNSNNSVINSGSNADASNNNAYGDSSNSDDLSSSKDITSSLTSSSQQNSSASSQGSSSQTASSSQNEGSSQSGSSSIQPELETLDSIIAKFVSDSNITVPALNSYDLSFQVTYYYAYSQYYISAFGQDRDGRIASQYALSFVESTNLVSQNDDDWYTVEDMGYLFSDSEGNFVINFYSEDGFFDFSITRNDGLTGTLDVSDVDTNWYVDYVNLQGFDLFSDFPVADLKDCLELDDSFVVPTIDSDGYVSYFREEAENEDGSVSPRAYRVIVKGDQIADYVAILNNNGYVAESHEEVSEEFDWETFDYVEVKYTVGSAYDANKNVYIDLNTTDTYGDTAIDFYLYDDIFTDEKTTNTDWTDEEKALMNSVLNYVIPFMQFGDNYELSDESDSSYNVICLIDSYSVDLSEQYINVLLANGFKEDSETYTSVCYVYDNGVVCIEIFVDYSYGNYLEIYSEDSHLTPLTAIELNKTAVDIVAGASFQLEASQTPANANHPINWASSNNDLATVDENGLVRISSTANAEDTVTITASSPSGVTASCTFTVKPNQVTGMEFTQETYTLIPGGEEIQPEYRLLPIGASAPQGAMFMNGFKNDGLDHTGIVFTGDGKLYAVADAVPGTKGTIFYTLGNTYYCYATVIVAAAELTDTLNREFFGIEKANYSKYLTYTKTSDNGAVYEATCAGNNGIQIRSKSDDSGVIGHCDGRTCKSITFTFDSNTEVPNAERRIDIYASNSAFAITDMFDSSMTSVGNIVFDKNNLTQTYTFTSNYSYIGFRSNNGAIYLTSVEIIWK